MLEYILEAICVYYQLDGLFPLPAKTVNLHSLQKLFTQKIAHNDYLVSFLLFPFGKRAKLPNQK